MYEHEVDYRHEAETEMLVGRSDDRAQREKLVSDEKSMMPTDDEIRAMVHESVRCPPAMRVAAWYLRAGGSESEWSKVWSRLRDLPADFMNQVWNYIRDIERGVYDLALIP